MEDFITTHPIEYADPSKSGRHKIHFTEKALSIKTREARTATIVKKDGGHEIKFNESYGIKNYVIELVRQKHNLKPSEFLLELLNKVAFLIPQNNSNPALNGMLLEL